MNKRVMQKISALKILVDKDLPNDESCFVLLLFILEYFKLNEAASTFSNIPFKMSRIGPVLNTYLSLDMEFKDIFSKFERDVIEAYLPKLSSASNIQERISKLENDDFYFLFKEEYQDRTITIDDFLSKNPNKLDILEAISEQAEFSQATKTILSKMEECKKMSKF